MWDPSRANGEIGKKSIIDSDATVTAPREGRRETTRGRSPGTISATYTGKKWRMTPCTGLTLSRPNSFTSAKTKNKIVLYIDPTFCGSKAKGRCFLFASSFDDAYLLLTDIVAFKKADFFFFGLFGLSSLTPRHCPSSRPSPRASLSGQCPGQR